MGLLFPETPFFPTTPAPTPSPKSLSRLHRLLIGEYISTSNAYYQTQNTYEPKHSRGAQTYNIFHVQLNKERRHYLWQDVIEGLVVERYPYFSRPLQRLHTLDNGVVILQGTQSTYLRKKHV